MGSQLLLEYFGTWQIPVSQNDSARFFLLLVISIIYHFSISFIRLASGYKLAMQLQQAEIN